MKSEINTLRQLQELVLTRDEHHQTGDGSHLDALNDSIAVLQAKLSPQVAAIYSRLYSKSHIVISAMNNNCCSGCGMQVPIAVGQQVRLGEHLVTCASCGRILYAVGEDGAKGVTTEANDDDEPKTGISRFSAEELMVVDLDAKDQVDVIETLACAMEKGGFIKNADSLVTAALERESVLSTAMDGGLAFPHVRGVEGGGLTLAMGVSKKGINWNGEKVKIVFLSAIPVAVSAFYLRLMSGLVQAFSKEANCKAALEATSSTALWKVLCKATRASVK